VREDAARRAHRPEHRNSAATASHGVLVPRSSRDRARSYWSQPSIPGSPSWCGSTIGARSAAGGSSTYPERRRICWVCATTAWRGSGFSAGWVGGS